MKKLLAIVISMAMLVAMMPMGVFAETPSGTGEGEVSTAVAQIGNDTYTTLSEAVAAVENSNTATTIELKKAVQIDSSIVIPATKSIELDLNGNIITCAKTAILNNGNLTIKDSGENGGIVSTGNVAVAVGDGSVTTINSGSFTGVEGAVITGYATGAKIYINNGNFTASDNAVIAGNGNRTNHDNEERVTANEIIIKGGTFNGGIKTEGYVACGIYAPWKDNITVSGGTFNITKGAGVVARAGNVTITGGTFNVNGNVTGKVGDSRVVVPCSPIVFDSAADYPAMANESKISVLGGTFKSDKKDNISLIKKAEDTNKRIQITGGTFSDLSALNYLGNNAKVTVELATDKTLDKGFSILEGKEVTLDLGGKKLSRNKGYLFDVYGALNIKNGTAEMTGAESGAAIWLNQTADLTIDSNATVIAKDSNNNKSSFAIGFYKDCTAANLVINGKLVGENGATVNGSITTAGNNVTVGKDAIIDVSGTGLYLAGVANTTVNGAKIKGGTTAIEIRAGELTVNGGEFESTATEYKCDPNGNGTTTEGAALAIAQHTTKKDIKVTVNDGTFEGIKALNESNPQANDPAPQVTLAVKDGTFDGEVSVTDASKFITGGTFSKSPKQYTAESYMVYKYSDAKYEVLAGDAEKPAGYTWTSAGEGVTDCDFIGTRIYVPSTPATPADNVTNNPADKNTTADLTPAVKDNKAETTVDAKTADKIVEKALENKSEEIIVDAAGNNNVASSEVGIPEKTVKEIAEKTDAKLVIKTDNGKVDLDKAAVKAVADQAGTTGTVKLIVETVKNDADICHVNLKLVTSNGAVTDFKGGNVKVTINLTKELAAKDVVCVYINDNGIYTLVNGQKNADGTYTFTTGHFSEYAVMAKEEADKKIAEQLDTMIKDVNLKVRTSKTAKKNIKAVVSGDVKAITDAGYTVKYKFYRSEKKASKYVGKVTKTSKTYVNTAGKKGTKYYYKAKALVYDGDKLVGQTVLTQCKYGARTWSK